MSAWKVQHKDGRQAEVHPCGILGRRHLLKQGFEWVNRGQGWEQLSLVVQRDSIDIAVGLQSVHG